jgi:hypothetical protein
MAQGFIGKDPARNYAASILMGCAPPSVFVVIRQALTQLSEDFVQSAMQGAVNAMEVVC